MKAKWIIFLVLASLLFCFPAQADMGPKPEINITVKNPPIEEYYLDLLIEGEVSENVYHNIRNMNIIPDEALLSLLQENRENGWHLGITDGTAIPMSGKLTGEAKDQKMIHHFGYVGVPDTFKIITVTKSGAVNVSEVYHRRSFITNLSYDYHTNSLKEIVPIAFIYLFQFATTCIPTLIIEGVLLLAFGFSRKRNWIIFLLVNLITQILLAVTMGQTLVKSGLLAAMMAQFFMELIILAGETTAYTFLLQGPGKGRRIGYGITANLCTWVMGIFIMTFQSVMISEWM